MEKEKRLNEKEQEILAMKARMREMEELIIVKGKDNP